MMAIARKIASALDIVVERVSPSPPANPPELADLGFAGYHLTLQGFNRFLVETIVVDVSDEPLSDRRLKLLSTVIGQRQLPNPVVIGRIEAEESGGPIVLDPTEFVRLNVPWRAVSAMPQEAVVPGEVDLDRFAREYRTRSARFFDGDAIVDGDADTLMSNWLNRPSSRPMVLRGIRGVGKTWQLIHFCQTSWSRFEASQGEYSPILYINLGNPQVGRLLLSGNPEGHSALALLRAHYGPAQLPWGGAVLAALLDSGAIALALDAFDEIYKQPTDEQVRNLGVSLSTQFSPGAKFLVSGRSVFLRFLPTRQNSRTNTGAVGGWYFLELLPVVGPDSHFGSISDGERVNVSPAVMAAAMGHPALRAEIHSLAESRTVDAATIREAVMNTFVEFNLRHERTRETYVRRLQGKVVRGAFSEDDRLRFLGELAWYMAERALPTIHIDRLPRRLARQFRLDSDAMRLDVRSQLVLEETTASQADGAVELSFAIGLRDTVHQRPVGETLTGAVFLSEFLADRLSEATTCPQLGLSYFLRFLGRVPLTDATASFCRSWLLDADRANDRQLIAGVKQEAVTLIRRLASAGGGQVFIACLRHLVSNLQKIHVISESEAMALDPWTRSISALLESTGQVLVPAASSPRLEELLKEPPRPLSRSFVGGDLDAVPRLPFLLGVHEVTNAEYEAFVWSEDGEEWRVRRITRAGSVHGLPDSPFAQDTNEYHLYFWAEDSERTGYRPRPATLDLPVSYVSWNASAAYCDWLSAKSGRSREYGFSRDRRDPVSSREVGSHGYRLPTLGEWLWAAYGATVGGTRSDLNYPWDWLAPGLSTDDLPPAMARRRESMMETQLEAGKEVGPVLEDELLDSGASGLVGNVKEWVDDAECDEELGSGAASKHVIAGATAYLGIDSFRFGYYVSLFSQNTNPDVGFRIARSLDTNELRAIEERERQLAYVSI